MSNPDPNRIVRHIQALEDTCNKQAVLIEVLFVALTAMYDRAEINPLMHYVRRSLYDHGTTGLQDPQAIEAAMEHHLPFTKD